MSTRHKEITQLYRIKGLVQGVGFRPFVYKTALETELCGWVKNHNIGVDILVQGTESKIATFLKNLKLKAPTTVNIKSIELVKQDASSPEMVFQEKEFLILNSENHGQEITQVSPDLAVCEACLEDMKTMPNRENYPFINCTQCGPRFSIIKDLPYDRATTTMDEFVMCASCKQEYNNQSDRRFHAQPNACSLCGPSYTLHTIDKEIRDIETIITTIRSLIMEGQVLAIKGIGGFNLVCNAQNNEAVLKLRKFKNREARPFAVMFPEVHTLAEYVSINIVEEQVLSSTARPIVLLEKKKALAPEVCGELNTIGALLPYMPIHNLLFGMNGDSWKIPLIFTSANITSEPIVIENEKALAWLGKGCVAVLTNNRDIHNRLDDSVVMVVNGEPRMIRRARGYTPQPVELSFSVEGIVAVGAELKQTFALGKGNQAIMSQYMGDIKNLGTYNFFEETLGLFYRLFRANPKTMVHDKHPDYLTTKYAQSKGKSLSLVAVQHHVAHIASCMAEHNLAEQVIGVAFDGAGYGDDGNIWGGEFFLMSRENYQRVAHFEYLPMPGGDRVTAEPWRMGVSYLYKYYKDDLIALNLPFIKNLQKDKLAIILKLVDKQVNTPLTSSVGRLLDALAAIMELCSNASYEAQGPMLLESLCITDYTKAYATITSKEEINVEVLVRGVVRDLQSGVDKGIIATKIHNTLTNIVVKKVGDIKKEYKVEKVVLSGGVFQNKYLLAALENALLAKGFSVYSNKQIPSNDSGISLGQIYMCSAEAKLGKINKEKYPLTIL